MNLPNDLPTNLKAKLEAKPKRSFKKYLAILFVLLALTGTGAYIINDWFQTHYLTFRSPIIFQAPVSISERSKLRVEDYMSLQKQLEEANTQVEQLKKELPKN